MFTFKNWKNVLQIFVMWNDFPSFLTCILYIFPFFRLHSWQTAIFWDQWDDHPYTMRPRYLMNFRPVNSMSFIWNDNMREKREANANATWRALIRDRRAVMAYKETETDVLYGVAVDRAQWWRIRGLKLTYYMAWQLTAQWWRIKGLKLTYYMAWKWRGGLIWRHCSRVAHARLHFLTAKWLNVIVPGK
jgi:hypothetical protein